MEAKISQRNPRKLSTKISTIASVFLVLSAAVFVVVLRNRTTAIGYELSNLKIKEKILLEERAKLSGDFAKLEKSLHSKYVMNSTLLAFPNPNSVIHLPQD
jgi:hypothetical protein